MSLPVVDTPTAGQVETTKEPRSSSGFGSSPLRRPAVRPLFLVALAITLLGASGTWFFARDTSGPEQITYSELLQAMDAGRVASITVRPGHDVIGSWAGTAQGQESIDFIANFPVWTVDGVIERAEAAGVPTRLEAAPGRQTFRDMMSLFLQALLVAAIGYLVYLQFRGGPGSKDIGKNAGSTTTFADVAGTQGAAEELRELVEFLKAPEMFASVGARIPKGALLVGPPGTGKTLLARAVAGEAGVPFYTISGSEITGFLVGLGAHRIKSLFKKARKSGGVVFIDEIDAIGGKRGRNTSHNEDDRTLNQLLVEMDGFSPSDGVVVIAATNRADDLDAALRRPGRFDRTIVVGLPTSEGREAILRLHAGHRHIPLHEDVDLARLARLTPGNSGAELANLLNEAAIAAAREGSEVVRWVHMESARDRLLLGKERPGFQAPDMEWQTVAYHEAGHALAGVVACPEDGLHKVTIQPRGHAMGVAFFSPEDNRNLYRRSYLEGQIIKGLAGRAAEELIFGSRDVTSGAQHDLVQVNGIARKMIYQLGMGPRTGLLIHEGQAGSLSPEAHAMMDREVRELLERSYETARDILSRNRTALEALALALLQRETIDGVEAVRLMEENGLVREIRPSATAA
jgi:cell division protease FtsH